MPGLISVIIIIDGKIMLVTGIIAPISPGNHLFIFPLHGIHFIEVYKSHSYEEPGMVQLKQSVTT